MLKFVGLFHSMKAPLSKPQGKVKTQAQNTGFQKKRFSFLDFLGKI